MTKISETYDVTYRALLTDPDGDTETVGKGLSFTEARRALWRAARGLANADVGDVVPPTPRALPWLRDAEKREWFCEVDDHTYTIVEEKKRVRA